MEIMEELERELPDLPRPLINSGVPWEHRFAAMLQRYNPGSLSSLPALVRTCVGQEEVMMAALVDRYGPEPADFGSSAHNNNNPLSQRSPGAFASPAPFKQHAYPASNGPRTAAPERYFPEQASPHNTLQNFVSQPTQASFPSPAPLQQQGYAAPGSGPRGAGSSAHFVQPAQRTHGLIGLGSPGGFGQGHAVPNGRYGGEADDHGGQSAAFRQGCASSNGSYLLGQGQAQRPYLQHSPAAQAAVSPPKQPRTYLPPRQPHPGHTSPFHAAAAQNPGIQLVQQQARAPQLQQQLQQQRAPHAARANDSLSDIQTQLESIGYRPQRHVPPHAAPHNIVASPLHQFAGAAPSHHPTSPVSLPQCSHSDPQAPSSRKSSYWQSTADEDADLQEALLRQLPDIDEFTQHAAAHANHQPFPSDGGGYRRQPYSNNSSVNAPGHHGPLLSARHHPNSEYPPRPGDAAPEPCAGGVEREVSTGSTTSIREFWADNDQRRKEAVRFAKATLLPLVRIGALSKATAKSVISAVVVKFVSETDTWTDADKKVLESRIIAEAQRANPLADRTLDLPTLLSADGIETCRARKTSSDLVLSYLCDPRARNAVRHLPAGGASAVSASVLSTLAASLAPAERQELLWQLACSAVENHLLCPSPAPPPHADGAAIASVAVGDRVEVDTLGAGVVIRRIEQGDDPVLDIGLDIGGVVTVQGYASIKLVGPDGKRAKQKARRRSSSGNTRKPAGNAPGAGRL
ncbi:hypothetical protein DIPPA_15093 [Diplonema papillatum]|nr:hypothetical protein DIPPA_15093 [Diplonema papillatum]